MSLYALLYGETCFSDKMQGILRYGIFFTEVLSGWPNFVVGDLDSVVQKDKINILHEIDGFSRIPGVVLPYYAVFSIFISSFEIENSEEFLSEIKKYKMTEKSYGAKYPYFIFDSKDLSVYIGLLKK
jgi:hypothetical protein